MATPNGHAAVCTPSSSERWLHCTAAPRYEEQFPSGTTIYAEEGTLAHSVCELFARKRFTVMTKRKFNAELKKLMENPLWADEMQRTAEFYVDYLAEKANEFPEMPHLAFEIRVDLSDYIPECFGTCDCAMIGGDTLRITDYKHGKGVAVSSVNNSQMRLYALGALKHYRLIYGDTIKKVVTAIVQPRISEDVTEEVLTVDELLDWGENVVKPKAQLAYLGMGTFEPGEWCRFCRGAAQCRKRAEYFAGFSQYIGADVEGRMTDSDMAARETADGYGADLPPLLTDEEVGALLVKAAGLVAWYNDLQSYALDAILTGKPIPGWKVVEGRKVRAFTDADAALERMKEAGYEEAVLYDRKPKTLAQLEKLTGKKSFEEIMSGLIVWPDGKPTLVEASDKRQDYTPKKPDASEFSEVPM